MAARLLLLNGVAILGVILFHATGYGFTAMFSWAHRYRPVSSPNYDEIGTTAYYALRLVEQLIVFCIPAFLFVSGYFASVLAGRSRSAPSARTLVARIRHLLVPYLVWSAVVLLLLALQGRVFTPARYVKALLTGATGPNYYYVPLLVQFYVLAPVLVAAARSHGRALLAGTALLQAGVYGLQYVAVLDARVPVLSALAASLPKWLFLAQLFWFTLGVVAGTEQKAFRAFLVRTRPLWPAAAVLLFAAGVVEWELLVGWSGHPWRENRITLVDAGYALSCVMAFLAYSDVAPPAPAFLADVGAKSFGIYLSHGVVMDVTARLLYHGAPWVLARQVLLQPIIIALGLAVPLAGMELLKRSRLRSAYIYVFG